MARYLISFDDGAMTVPEEELPEVDEAAHAVVREAQDAGVWVFGGGLNYDAAVSVVDTDGAVADGRTGSRRIASVDSRSSTCPHVGRRWSGPPRSPSPAAVRRRSGSSCPTRPSERRPSAPSPPTGSGGAPMAGARMPDRERAAADHAAGLLAVYQAGLDGGDASFETTVRTGRAGTPRHLAAHRFVALDEHDEVVGWVAPARSGPQLDTPPGDPVPHSRQHGRDRPGR